MKKNKVILNIVSVFCFIYGAMYIFSLVFIPIGIYCLSAGKKFNYKADHLLDNYAIDKKAMRFYTTFVSIFCFPFGLLSIIAYLGIYGNNVKIDDFEQIKVTDIEEETNSKTEETENSDEEKISQNSQDEDESEEEKLKKLEKLKNFRDKNIISEEEFEMAKEQMFGKKTNK